MKKIVYLILLLCIFVGILVGCQSGNKSTGDGDTIKETSGSGESSGEVLEFVYVTQDIANPYFIEVYNGFKDKCKELGISTQVLDAKYDVASQRTYVEDALERGVDGIMISPLDQNALTDLVDKAKEAGIVIAAEAQPIDNAQIDAKLDEYSIGRAIGGAAAEWINEKLNGKGNVLLIAQDDVEAVIQRTDGTRDAIMENAPESVIVARQNGSNTEMAMKVTESILQSNPQVNVICTCDDYSAIGAYEGVNSMNMATPTFYIGGCDATEEGLSKMKENGSVYRSSINLFPYEAGQEIAQAMYDYLTETAQDTVVPRRYEAVWQADVLEESNAD